ncbi:DUF423 domain-containing protein [Aestuariivivens sediminis]|uniref:DUF423 domain-containing protein n=1 Tax=Aestuariivivens sediminis TaxID=2913557 RepID=UPI001F578B4B|nr:DUF423 domain-containing protein [Aestuariivivens sediminis]
MNRKILIVAGIMGLTGVIIGALGAHALKELISVEAQQSFETGVRYQMYHALFLLFVGHSEAISFKSKKSILYLVLSGVLLFSGSIYALATNTLTLFNFKSIAFITPLGGLLLILGWLVLIINLSKS